MWMSLMTSGVKIRLCPRMVRWEGAVSSAMGRPPLQDELALGGLEGVVVVELLAADELLQLRRVAEAVDAELALDQLGVGVGPVAGDAVDAQRLDLAGDVDRPVVHRVAQAGADVAEDDLAAALHHEAGHRPGAPADDDRAALLVDARAGADPPVDDEVAAADRRARERAGVAVDDDDARHHVLARRPADAALDVDLRAVDEPAAEVAERAVERDSAAAEDADAERVLRARVEDRDVLDPLLVDQPPQLGVDLSDREVARVELRAVAVDLRDARRRPVDLDQAARVVRDPRLAYRCHTITSPS